MDTRRAGQGQFDAGLGRSSTKGDGLGLGTLT